MKLTRLIRSAQGGYEQLRMRVEAKEAEVKRHQAELSAMRRELDSHREMLNGMHKLQDSITAQNKDETIEFKDPGPTKEELGGQ